MFSQKSQCFFEKLNVSGMFSSKTQENKPHKCSRSSSISFLKKSLPKKILPNKTFIKKSAPQLTRPTNSSKYAKLHKALNYDLKAGTKKSISKFKLVDHKKFKNSPGTEQSLAKQQKIIKMNYVILFLSFLQGQNNRKNSSNFPFQTKNNKKVLSLQNENKKSSQ